MRRVVTKKSSYSSNYWRIKFLWFFILLFGLVIISRLFWLQVIKYKDYEELANIQHDISKELLPERGGIFFQDTRPISGTNESRLFPAATTKSFYLVYAQTFAVENPQETLDKLNSVLFLPQDVLDKILKQLQKQNDPFEPLVHRVTEEKISQLKILNLSGIKWQEEKLRYYPQNRIGSNVVGFVGWVGDELLGQYGVEGYFDSELKGEKGFQKSERDAAGRLIGIGEQNIKSAVGGSDIVLTIDNSIEAVACQKLDEAVSRYEAVGGTVIVMQPQTGAILAMCGNPDFDPNAYNEVKNPRAYTNPAIFDPYEPGSVFKAITMAIALDQNKVAPETTYEDTGEEKFGNFIIHNSDLLAHGTRTMTQVLEESLNTGAIFAMRQVGTEVFKQYVEKFGFGKITGITINKEVAGNISSLNEKGEIYSATASFGQGITTTPLQMVTAYAVLANGGKLVKPYIVDRMTDSFGNVQKNEPQVVGQVISARASALVSGMLVQVVKEGHAKKADIPGYYIAGKTGTAEISEGSGGYGLQNMHTFIGYGPVSNPQFVMLVRLDRPHAKFAESTAVPTFAEIAKFIVNYYQIKPDAK